MSMPKFICTVVFSLIRRYYLRSNFKLSFWSRIVGNPLFCFILWEILEVIYMCQFNREMQIPSMTCKAITEMRSFAVWYGETSWLYLEKIIISYYEAIWELFSDSDEKCWWVGFKGVRNNCILFAFRKCRCLFSLGLDIYQWCLLSFIACKWKGRFARNYIILLYGNLSNHWITICKLPSLFSKVSVTLYFKCSYWNTYLYCFLREDYNLIACVLLCVIFGLAYALHTILSVLFSGTYIQSTVSSYFPFCWLCTLFSKFR